MKFTLATVAALAVVFLALAEATKIEFNRKEMRNKIIDRTRSSYKLAVQFANNYMKRADSEGISELDSGRWALAAKLMVSVGGARWDDLVFFSDEDLVGKNLDREIKTLRVHVDKSDQLADVKLEGLIRLAAELPAGNGIAKDVKAIIEDISDSSQFLQALGSDADEEQQQQA